MQAQEPDKEQEFEYLTAYNASGTFTPPRNGLYKIYCVGKSGDGYTPTNYNGGGGGGSGGIAVSKLILSAKQSYPFTITDSKSEFGTDGFYATAGKSSTGTSGGDGGLAFGGNIANDGGYKGGHSGSNTQYAVGEDGLNGGMKGGYYVGLSTSGCIFGGGGGGGARLPPICRK